MLSSFFEPGLYCFLSCWIAKDFKCHDARKNQRSSPGTMKRQMYTIYFEGVLKFHDGGASERSLLCHDVKHVLLSNKRVESKVVANHGLFEKLDNSKVLTERKGRKDLKRRRFDICKVSKPGNSTWHPLGLEKAFKTFISGMCTL